MIDLLQNLEISLNLFSFLMIIIGCYAMGMIGGHKVVRQFYKDQINNLMISGLLIEETRSLLKLQAEKQFKKAIHLLEAEGLAPHFHHCANTAATILMPEAYFNFVRVGIGMYGLWPSDKTLKAAERAGINIELKPVMTWKTVIIESM